MKMRLSRDRVIRSSAILVATFAIVLTAFNLQRTYSGSRPNLPARNYQVPQWHQYAMAGHRIGPAGASVTVLMFSDYECDPCKRAMVELRQLQAKNAQVVALVIRHYPAVNHHYASDAARAAICSEHQSRFEEMNDSLFAASDSFPVWPMSKIAASAGIGDTVAFKRCLRDPATDEALARDLQAGKEVGVAGTPTLVINGDHYTGASAARHLPGRYLDTQ